MLLYFVLEARLSVWLSSALTPQLHLCDDRRIRPASCAFELLVPVETRKTTGRAHREEKADPDEKDGWIDQYAPLGDHSRAEPPYVERIALDIEEKLEQEGGQVVSKACDRCARRLQPIAHDEV